MVNQYFFRNWIALLVIFGLLGFLGYLVYFHQLKAPLDPNGQTKAFVIKKGESLEQIIERLEKEKIARSRFALKQILKKRGIDSNIQAGDYKLSASMSADEIVDNLSQGAVDVWVTLLEGWRVEEMARELKSRLNISEISFIDQAKKYEGQLFPDTYLFNKDASIETIILTLRNTFDQKYNNDLQSQIRQKGLTPEQGVILASLIEREGRSDGDRKQVASIILKRLKIGMKLDIDATVRYAKDSQVLNQGKFPDKFWQAITQADYSEVRSPYNTYLNPGLPPKAICNPSLSSIKVVAQADPNIPYLFYYHDSKGNPYYARTLDEHNQNVANNP